MLREFHPRSNFQFESKDERSASLPIVLNKQGKIDPSFYTDADKNLQLPGYIDMAPDPLTRNWRIYVDALNQFGFQDTLNNRYPFLIEPNSPNNSIRITPGGVGFGTSDVEVWSSNHFGSNWGTRGGILATKTSGSGGMYFMENLYYDGSWRYRSSDEASLISLIQTGEIAFYTIPSGTADAGITMSSNEAMRIENDGKVRVASGLIEIQNGTSGGRVRLENPVGSYRLEIQTQDASGNMAQRQLIAGASDTPEITWWHGAAGSEYQIMELDANGRLGIGTTTPDHELEVEKNQASPTRLAINNPNANGVATLLFKEGGSYRGWVEFDNAGNDLFYRNNQTGRHIFQAHTGGGCYIQLRPNAAMTLQTNCWQLESDLYGGFFIRKYTGSAWGTYLQIQTNGVAVHFTPTGSAANAFLSTSGLIQRNNSSRRYKQDIQDLPGRLGFDTIMALRPVSYYSTCEADDPTKRFVGLVAEEVSETLGIENPYVDYDKHGEPESIQYPALVVPLIAMAQSQQRQLEALTQRIAKLEEM